MLQRYRLASLCALLLILPAVAAAQVAVPSVRAVRVASAPVIDGHLDEPAWGDADAIVDFRQRDPEEGAAATEPTTLRILYDDSSLYIGVLLQDAEPDKILAGELRRDDGFGGDDTFAVLIDTFHDRRNGFLFRVNPNGARYDAVVRNESQIDSDWDEQWWAEARIGPQGWTVEMAIPFKTLRFDPARVQEWGINFQRVIRRKNEEVYWTNWDRDFDFQHVSQAGVLTGLDRIRQGQRFRLRPYVAAGVESLDAVEPARGTRVHGDIGIDDLKIAISSNVTADIAVNPDFAQTEIDQQRVNLTRFSLFFPEKRQFFLEGAESLRMSPSRFQSGQLELFHSRRIGLSGRGEPIPLIGGAKLTGKVRGVDLGVLGARTDNHGDEPGENFGVVRFRRELLGRSYIGGIATARNGVGPAHTALGADARFVLKRHLTLSGLAARADDGSADPQWARYVGAEWDDDFLEAGFSHTNIDRRFDSGLGFAGRQDRQTEVSLALSPRPSGGPVRQFGILPGLVFNHDDQGTLLTREVEFETLAEFQSGESLTLAFENIRENLQEPFEIEDAIVLPARPYDWSSVEVRFSSFEGRPLSGSMSFEAGGFYSGTSRTLEGSATMRLGRHVRLSPDYEMNDVDLAEGAFRTHLVGVRSDVAVNRNVLTSMFFQYNSEGDLAALQVRLNYLFRNIDSFYLVYNETRATGGDLSGRSNRSLVAKLTYSLHR